MESRKQLGCRGKFNGRTKYSHNYGFNQEFFLYLQYKLGPHLDEDQLLLLQHSSMKPMKVTDPDLSNRNKRVREKHTIFRAVEEPAIKRIRDSCGILGVVNPDPAPSLKDIDAGNAKPSKLLPLYSPLIILRKVITILMAWTMLLL